MGTRLEPEYFRQPVFLYQNETLETAAAKGALGIFGALLHRGRHQGLPGSKPIPARREG